MNWSPCLTRVVSNISRGAQQHHIELLQPRGSFRDAQRRCGPFASIKIHRMVHVRYVSYEQEARALNQKGIDDQLSEYNTQGAEEKEKQRRTPWHREGVADAPASKPQSAARGAEGKLLTTTSRLLKLVLPLSNINTAADQSDVAPLALLVHPSQPLSYLSRLIQSEIPSITTAKGDNRVPDVSFHAKESKTESVQANQRQSNPHPKSPDEPEDHTIGEGGVESYSGAGREAEHEQDGDFVKWSASTEIGDFIRDAARAKEFIIQIEGREDPVKVAVPSFNDRTFYLRQRLRRTAAEISQMAKVKNECDRAAHRAGQRIAMAGCGVLVGYWYLVYRLTFKSGYGWDLMEPVTFLISHGALIGGYLWFLYHNREASYRSAMNLTISRRQSKLYQQKGFDPSKWEALIEEGNAIRKEIKAVAAEYDVQWDETADEKDPQVAKALREERRSNNKSDKKDQDDDEAD